MKDRNRKCPECGGVLLARSGTKIICLNFGCPWEIESRRDEDKEIPDLSQLKKDWN